jgi:hypothetical protein
MPLVFVGIIVSVHSNFITGGVLKQCCSCNESVEHLWGRVECCIIHDTSLLCCMGETWLEMCQPVTVLMKCGIATVIRNNGKCWIFLYFPNLCFVYNCLTKTLETVCWCMFYILEDSWNVDVKICNVGFECIELVMSGIILWWELLQGLSFKNIFLRMCGIQINMVVFETVVSSLSF